jgi:heavy metal sensor kinase
VHEVAIAVTKPEDDESGPASRPMQAVVACGKSLVLTEITVRNLERQLFVALPLVLLASLAGGWFLISRALRPIDRIARTAAEINATDLSRRISVRGGDEIARLSQTLNATFDRLERGFERERRFTADASHELRTPLAAVAGNVEVALRQDRPPAEYRQILADVGDAAARMQAIVEGLLTLARTDAGAAPPSRPVALGPLCEEAVRLHRPIADRAQVSIDLATEPGISVPGHAEHLKTVISNLVANAIRYNHPGGRVAIGIAREDGHARIRVDDTGIGISPQDLPHVFERFYRADPSRSASTGGVGLGLAIAKAIVERHAGTISVTSLPDRGSRFEVLIPLERDPSRGA